LQGAAFVNVFEGGVGPQRWARGQAEPEALLTMAQRILGEDAALALFQASAREQGKEGFLPDPTPGFLDIGWRPRLSGTVGAATANAMISQLVGRATVTVEDLMAVASESAQIMEYSAQLEAREAELTRTAGALREANEKLMQLSIQKDAFLSQISHELRTPMTSIRAFSEILTEGDLPPEMVVKYGRIIHDEAKRLTRLLDDLLDLSVLENGTVQLNLSLANLHQMIDTALTAARQTRPERSFIIHRDLPAEAIYICKPMPTG
jgi:signal transduction histidine kinase